MATEEAAYENYGKELEQESSDFGKVCGVGDQIAVPPRRHQGCLKLFPKDCLYDRGVVFEEQELKDVRNYLDVLLRGAEDRAELPEGG